MGLASLQVTELGLVSAGAGKARKGIAAAPKVSNPSLRYVASYARTAIQVGEFSLHDKAIAHCTRNKIAQRAWTALQSVAVASVGAAKFQEA
jgi:hypothetical protein